MLSGGQLTCCDRTPCPSALPPRRPHPLGTVSGLSEMRAGRPPGSRPVRTRLAGHREISLPSSCTHLPSHPGPRTHCPAVLGTPAAFPRLLASPAKASSSHFSLCFPERRGVQAICVRVSRNSAPRRWAAFLVRSCWSVGVFLVDPTQAVCTQASDTANISCL